MNETTLEAYAMEKGMKTAYSEMSQDEKIALAMEMFLDRTSYAAGNYAKENETLAGSLGTARAAMTNFLDGSGSVDQLVGAFSNAANVIVGSLSEIAPRLVQGVTDLINQLLPLIPPLLQTLLPVIIEGAVSLLNGLVAAFPTIVGVLLQTLPMLIEGIVQIINGLITALPSLIQVLVAALPTLIPALIDGIVSMIVTLCANIGQIIQPLIDALPTVIQSIASALLSNLPALIQGAVDLVVALVVALPQIISALISAMPTIVGMMVEALIACLPTLLTCGGQLLMGLLQGIWDALNLIPEALMAVFLAIWNGIKALFGIHSPSTVMMEIGKMIMQGLVNGIKSLLSVCNTIWTGIKDFISNTWDSIKTKVGNMVDNIKVKVSGVFNSIKTSVTNVWNGIKNAIKKPIESARDLVDKAIEKIKGFFNFEFKWPKIPLPHFSISGSLNPLDWFDQGLPSIGIEWYAKAMKNPMIMDEPTIFGYNPATGSLMGGGEAGSEVVTGTNTLLAMIGDAVSKNSEAQTERLVAVMTAVLNAIVSGNRDTLEALLAGQTIKLNEREFARTVRAYA